MPAVMAENSQLAFCVKESGVKRIGIIGCGIIGRMHADVVNRHPGARLLAVCDSDRKALGEVTDQTGAEFAFCDYKELLSVPEIDAVHVALPDHLHTQVVVAALREGKDVLLEKPMTTSVEEAELIAGTVRETGRMLMVNFSNRWMNAFTRIKKIIKDGGLGTVRHFSGMLSNTTYIPCRMLGWSGNSSPAFFLLPHVMDIAAWLLEDEITGIYAIKTCGVLESKGIKTHDTMAALCSFAGGASAQVETAWILPETLPRPVHSYYRVIGTDGMAIWDRHNDTLQVYSSSEIIIDEKYEEPPPGFFEKSVSHFISCLNNEEEPVSGVEDGLRNVRAICAMEESARTGRVISPGLPGDE